MAKLVFKTSDDRPLHTVNLADGVYLVGRGSQCRLIIPHSSVSTRHCELLVHGTEVIVRESGSKNGTLVNGIRVKGQMPVKSGQVIQFGLVPAELILPPPPPFGSDDSCESAVFDHRRYMNQSEKPGTDRNPGAEVEQFPVNEPCATEAPTLVYAPAAEARAALPQETINLGEPDTQPVLRRSSLWLYLGLAVFAIVLVWLFRRVQ
jgi:hypothetical protein